MRRLTATLSTVRAIATFVAMCVLSVGCSDTTASVSSDAVWSRTLDVPLVPHPDGLDLVGFGRDGGVTALNAATGQVAWYAQIARRGPVTLEWFGERFAARDTGYFSPTVYGNARTGAVYARASSVVPDQAVVGVFATWILVQSADTLLVGLSAMGDSIRWRIRVPRRCAAFGCQRVFRLVGQANGDDAIIRVYELDGRSVEVRRVTSSGVMTTYPFTVERDASLIDCQQTSGRLCVFSYPALAVYDAQTGSRVWEFNASTALVSRGLVLSGGVAVERSVTGGVIRLAAQASDSSYTKDAVVAFEIDLRTGTVQRETRLVRPYVLAPEIPAFAQYFGACGKRGVVSLLADGNSIYVDWASFRIVELRGPRIEFANTEFLAIGQAELLTLQFPDILLTQVNAFRCGVPIR